eukprot:g113.t1
MDAFMAHVYCISFGWGAMAIGVLVMMFQGKGAWRTHMWIQSLGLSIVVLGWYFGYLMGSGDAVAHFVIGTIAVILALLQSVGGFCRHLDRRSFSKYHPWVGIIVFLLAMINIAIGISLAAYNFTLYIICLCLLLALIACARWRGFNRDVYLPVTADTDRQDADS